MSKGTVNRTVRHSGHTSSMAQNRTVHGAKQATNTGPSRVGHSGPSKSLAMNRTTSKAGPGSGGLSVNRAPKKYAGGGNTGPYHTGSGISGTSIPHRGHHPDKGNPNAGPPAPARVKAKMSPKGGPKGTMEMD